MKDCNAVQGDPGELKVLLEQEYQAVAASSEAARQTVEATEIIRLSVEDQRLFAESIINPPEPNAALRRAFEKHRELFGTEWPRLSASPP